MFRVLSCAALAAVLAVSAAAGEVKVSGLHNCCGACGKAINKALTDAGATEIKVVKKEVTFQAADGDKAVQALFDAGFAGTVTGAKEPAVDGGKGKEVKFEGIHNCCGSCAGPINAALKKAGVKATVKGREATFVVASETEVDGEAVIKALRAIGYNAKVAK